MVWWYHNHVVSNHNYIYYCILYIESTISAAGKIEKIALSEKVMNSTTSLTGRNLTTNCSSPSCLNPQLAECVNNCAVWQDIHKPVPVKCMLNAAVSGFNSSNIQQVMSIDLYYGYVKLH